MKSLIFPALQRIVHLTALVVIVFSLASCSSAQRDEFIHRRDGVTTATIGGAIIGAFADKNNAVRGAFKGAAIGNTAAKYGTESYIHGKQKEEDQKADERQSRFRQQNPPY